MTIMHEKNEQSAASVSHVDCGKKRTVIVFDWDDTLMASSWVDRAKLIQIESFSVLPPGLQTVFSKLEEHVSKCLTAAQKLGEVVIITNAESGWVEYSSKRFMPRLVKMLEGVRVVSARSTYERFYPGAPLCWKAAAFAHEANQLFGTDDSAAGHSDGSKQIISFGDSNEERTAVKIAAGQLGATAKSIKFVDLPTPEQLCKQVEKITGWLDWVVQHDSELDLMMKAAIECADNGHMLGGIPSISAVACDIGSGEPWRPPALSTLDAAA